MAGPPSHGGFGGGHGGNPYGSFEEVGGAPFDGSGPSGSMFGGAAPFSNSSL